jgi:hypothetical protein
MTRSLPLLAFSSEVDTGSREENTLKQQSGASLLIQSEARMLQPSRWTKVRLEPEPDRKPFSAIADGPPARSQ